MASFIGLHSANEDIAFFHHLKRILAPSLLVDVSLDNPAPGATDQWSYRIRYRCASVTEPCQDAYIDLTLPLGANSAGLPGVGGNVSKVTKSGDESTGVYVRLDLQSSGLSYLEAGSSGAFSIVAKWECVAEGETQTPTAGSSINLVNPVVFHEASASLTATDPSSISVPVRNACPPPPSTSKDFTKKDNEGGANIVQANGTFEYKIIPKSPANKQIEYVDNIPSELEVYNFRLDRAKWGGWKIQCDCGNGFVTIRTSKSKNMNAYSWVNGQKNKAHFPNLYGEDDSTDTGCDGLYDPNLRQYVLKGLKAIKWITADSGYQENEDIRIYTRVLSNTSAGTTIQNCSDASFVEKDSLLGSSCKDITVVSEPIVHNKVSIKGKFGTTDVSQLSGYNKEPDDILYEIQHTYLNMNGANHTGFTITDTLDKGLSYYTTGQNPNWYGIKFSVWKHIPSSLNLQNQPGCSNPVFSKTLLDDGRTVLKWEFPACTFAGGLSHSSNPRIFIYFTARYDRTISLPSSNYYSRVEVDYGKQTWKNTKGGKLANTVISTTKINLGSSSSFGSVGSVDSKKWIKGELDSDFSRYPNFGSTNNDGEAIYEIFVWNLTDEPVTKMDIADRLPHLNDFSLLGGQARDSKWSMELDSSIRIDVLSVPSNTWVPVPAADLPLGVMYGNAYNSCYLDNNDFVRADPAQANLPAGCSDMDTLTQSEGAKTFAFRWENTASPLQFGQGLRIRVKVRQLTGELDPASGELAWNSFAYTATQKNSGELFSSEPLKVGVQMVDVATTASIGDRVWKDANGNGIQDPGEEGIEGVELGLYESYGDTVTIGGFPYRVKTDSLGTFLFNGLPMDSTYIIRLDRDADFVGAGQLKGLLLSQKDAGAEAADSDAALGNNAGTDSGDNHPEISAAKTDTSSIPYKDYDFGFYSPVSLGDLVWVDVNENGQQDEGEPGYEGIWILLLASDGSVLDSVQSDTIGKYAFTNLPPSTYSLKVKGLPIDTTITFQDMTGEDQLDSDAKSDGTTDQFVLSTDLNTMDIGLRALPPGPASIRGKVWDELTTSNGKIDPAEGNMKGITVQLLDDGKFTIGSTQTDSSGAYSFEDLDPRKDYYVQFVLPDTFMSFAVPGEDMDVDSSGITALISLEEDQDTMGIDAGVIGLFSIGNLVWADADADGLLDVGESGISGVSVYLLDGASNAVLDSTITDANGKYVFSGLSSGSFKVELNIPAGYRSSPDSVDAGTPNARDNDDNGIGTSFSGKARSQQITLSASGGSASDANYTESDHGQLINGVADLTSNPKAYYTVDFGFAILPSSESNCLNGIDDDGDGKIDCADSDCYCKVVSLTITVNSQTSIGPRSIVPIHLSLINETGDDAFNVDISDVLPTGFRFLSDSIEYSNGASNDSLNLPIFGDRDTIRWAGLNIPSGDTILISYAILADSSLADGTYKTQITASRASLNPSTVSVTMTSLQTNTSDPEEYICDPAFFQVYKKKRRPNYFAKLNPTSGEYHELAVLDANANGLGFDPQTNLVFGASGTRFIRLDKDGRITDLGINFAKKCYVGDMDQSGHWFGKVGNDMIKIDVSGPAIVGTYTGQGMPGWDMAYNLDGKFYAVHDNKLYVFDPNTRTKSYLGNLIGSNLPTGGYGAQWTGSDSMLYISNNKTGKIFQVNIQSRAATLVMQSTSGLQYNDGFSCPTTLPAVCGHDYGDFSQFGPALSILPTQDANGDQIPDMDAIWLGKTALPDSIDLSNEDASGDPNDDGLILPKKYKPGGTVDFDITVNTNMTNKKIHYGLWVDWDEDTVFDAFRTGTKTISQSNTLTETLIVPLDFAGGDISARLRIAENDIKESDATGNLGLGETEDFMARGSLPANVSFARSTNTGLETEAQNTWGAAWGDYDNDGDDDLLIPDYSHWKPSRLYTNNGDGTFTETSASAPTSDRGSNVGASWGDYDNDGDLDIYMANNVRISNKIYINNGNGTFSSSPDQVAGKYEGYSHSACWVDYDNDGDLDVFSTDFMPTRYNQLFQNQGDGTFVKAADATINMEVFPTFNAVWGDYDKDGLMDVFVPNLRGEHNSLYHNDGNGKFSKVTSGSISSDGGNSHSASWADYDNDGDLDLFVCNASNQQDFFYVNNGDGSFTKNTSLTICTEVGHSFGSVWGDFDLDGYIDLYVVRDNGNANSLFFNNGDGTFLKDETSVLCTDAENSISPSFTDFDNDGDLDIFVANNRYKTNTLYVSDASSRGNHWAGFDLTGSLSNRDGIGARVQVKCTIGGVKTWQSRQCNALSGGVSSQSSSRIHFGLAESSSMDSVVVYWPSGCVSYLTNQSADTVISIIEPQSADIVFLAFHDSNDNCILDAGETRIPNISGRISQIGHQIASNQDGIARLNLAAGSYQFVQDTIDNYTHPCFVNQTFSVTIGQADTIFLPQKPDSTGYDVWVNISGTAQRRGLRNTYQLAYGNEGTSTANDVEVAVTFDPEVIPLESDVPWDRKVGSNTYVWEFSSIDAFDKGIISITDSVSALAAMGSIKQVSATCAEADQDYDLSDNNADSFEPVVGPIDPNDILVLPKDTLMKGDLLTYRIRFQNVGSFFAENVIITDTFPESLDLESLQIIGTSHYQEMVLKGEGIVEFRFEYIMLPDSGMNEEESHGFVEFTILPYEEVHVGKRIYNRAAIVFDNEKPIITNTAKTIIWDKNIPVGFEEEYSQGNAVENGEGSASDQRIDPFVEVNGQVLAFVFPNPAEYLANLNLKGKPNQSFKIQIVDSFGRMMFRREVKTMNNQHSIYLPIQRWTAGYYYIHVVSGDESQYVKFVKQ